MKIACLSGKGGAGKTLVAVNLAAAAGNATYIDCDVEEPNGGLFLKPHNISRSEVSALLPQFDGSKCSGCRACVEFCRFHALMFIKDKPVVFPEICHSCGGCALVCPEAAITEAPKKIGILETGNHENIRTVTGILDPGEASGVPIIHEALKHADGTTVIDCPPGSACSVMESIMDADYCLLVAEPTAFGFHNFKMVYELVSLLDKKCGVVINKQEAEFEPLEEFCRKENIHVLGRIPYDPEIASLTAEGQIAFEKSSTARDIFSRILKNIGGAL